MDGRIVVLSRPAGSKERMFLRHGLSLNEQLVESRMLPVCVMRRQGEFDVARQIETAGPQGTIDQRQTPNLDVVVRDNDDLRLALYPKSRRRKTARSREKSAEKSSTFPPVG